MSQSIRNHVVRNVILLIGGILLAVFFSQLELFSIFVSTVGRITYLDAFIGGLMFVFTFTIPVGALVLVSAADHLPVIFVALIGGLGAVLGDFLIFRFVRDNLLHEVEPICAGPSSGYFKRIFCSRYFRWTMPVLGAIIVALPLPDELGVGLMGFSQMSSRRFLLITYILDTAGILILIAGASIFR